MKEECWIVLDIFIVYGILIQILLFHILWWAYPHVLLKILVASWMDCNIHFCGNNDNTRNTSFVATTNSNYIKQFWRNCVTMINLNSHPRLVILTDSAGGECRSAAYQGMIWRWTQSTCCNKFDDVGGRAMTLGLFSYWQRVGNKPTATMSLAIYHIKQWSNLHHPDFSDL